MRTNQHNSERNLESGVRVLTDFQWIHTEPERLDSCTLH